ncbi:UDP-N-acetylmuramate dehydrogenase [Pantoea sp. Mhis]|uniref:UDP-N-acetylmuramate dehydrogenase n=1 Tax=Pantoea sp. Mhis TaxID=2576759 RepID=UPI001357CBC8|nr:UDP-N-acetylmuramate dehydrogenase [Pantoea sp. Mhis]MXP56508.1 UDP-N-acetylmuramate dehydrogenase [Pantoea sp. Mhis]
MYNSKPSLKPFNTLGIDVSAHNLIIARNLKDIISAWQISQQVNEPFIILGEGSNILFLENFNGSVVINSVKGIEINEHDTAWYLHVAAGENWHALVELTLIKGIYGLENLAFIPGKVGSAPIQNIGAYGVEFKNVCNYVEVLHLPTQQIVRLYREECQFGYRDSVFKHAMKRNYAIIAVGLCIKKRWKPVINYGDLVTLDPNTVCAKDIFKLIQYIRKNKFPNPSRIGNVGSFFKNPFITQELSDVLIEQWPSMPYYRHYYNNKIKLAAGWLIEQCHLKGYRVGGAAVYRKHALVIINQYKATSQDIIILAQEVRNKVGKKFNVWLEPEVRFIGAYGECDAVELIS